MLYEKIKENKDKILSFATLFLIVLAAFYFVNNNSSEKVFNTKTINQKSNYYGSRRREVVLSHLMKMKYIKMRWKK